jgi:hypothetical protein
MKPRSTNMPTCRTLEFLQRVESLIDHPLDVTRAQMLSKVELALVGRPLIDHREI